ncbi:hypothetical protein, partial [Mesorhizobium sp. M1C.F.Ca.ET.212.01.1.1]|uniref:hypothetical protein n=1 Tax=Mesorhizobium sp. M1C.F.Ca.ET.212.01.1.1 TaxID=2500527 RepID=UPI001AEE1813
QRRLICARSQAREGARRKYRPPCSKVGREPATLCVRSSALDWRAENNEDENYVYANSYLIPRY